MRPRDFSAVVLLCALFAVLLMTQSVRAQTHPLWLQGDPSDTDPDLERLNRAFIRLAEKVRQAVVQVRVEPTKARGSGFIIDPQGYILTAHHVVNEAKEIEIRLANRQRVRGEIVATDAQVDFAIIKINGEGEFPVLPLGDSDWKVLCTWASLVGVAGAKIRLLRLIIYRWTPQPIPARAGDRW